MTVVADERWEKVHLYTDFYDGPLIGIADCEGLPHLFENLFSEEEDEYTKFYRLEPVDEVRFAMMTECNKIWRRWQADYASGKATLETHPALPPERERERYDQLKLALRGRDTPNPGNSRVLSARIRKIGKFEWEICWESPGV